jgi:hypothetical protein
LLDIGLLPAFAVPAAALVAVLEWPAAPVYALTSPKGGRAAWGEQAGLHPLATLPGWLRLGDERQALSFWAR